MDDEKLKKQIGTNIATCRKRIGLTQAGLAEKLNYSDKAVSKWERGESIPDVLTLSQLAKLFQVPVDDLLKDPDQLPENPGRLEKVMGKAVEKTFKRKADKRIILHLSSLLVWIVALMLYVILSFFDLNHIWLAFVYAIPADAIVRLSLLSAWRDYRWNRLWVSLIMWGCLLSVFATVYAIAGTDLVDPLWRIFLLGIPGQLAIFLWFRMYRKVAVEEPNE